jgi:hypothetical protein
MTLTRGPGVSGSGWQGSRGFASVGAAGTGRWRAEGALNVEPTAKSPNCATATRVCGTGRPEREIPNCDAIKNRRWASYLDVKSRGC